MVERIAQIKSEAEAAIAAASDAAALEDARVRYLGRKSELTGILRGIAELPAEERGPVGKASNEARVVLEQAVGARAAQLEAESLGAALAADALDVTLPGIPPAPAGHLHLITQTRREIEDAFVGLGYQVVEGPEIELDYYNFEALNHPHGHPARSLHDTFYVDGEDDVLLRTHTSPMQVRAMEEIEPPIFVVVPGKVYRRDSDATHTPMFHQVEGLAVAEDLTLADLKGTLEEFAHQIFGGRRRARIRPHFFPFTEPSVEVDIDCFACEGTGTLEGERCSLCKGIGWLEILGAGMIDPNVFGFVAEKGYDPERVQGFAFGVGVERVAMLKHGVPDLRLFFENDIRMLEQF